MNTDDRQQHIEAIARAIDPKAFLVPDYVPGTTPAMYQDAARGDAARIFDSTDPAVHDALTAALTRHGVICEGCEALPGKCRRAIDAGFVKCCPDCTHGRLSREDTP